MSVRLVRPGLLFVLAMAILAAACGQSGSTDAPPRHIGDPLGVNTPVTDGSDEIHIAFLGDSITAGLGLNEDQAYPEKIRQLFAAEGYGEVQVINGGVSGDTTAGGLRRAPQLLTPNVKVLVIALGGNDALRGLRAAQTRDNIVAIIELARAADIPVLVAGMLAPTNLGEDYQIAFREAFNQIATQYRGQIAYVPFLLEGVAGVPELNQSDGIHPNERGAQVIAELLFPQLRNIVDRIPRAGQ